MTLTIELPDTLTQQFRKQRIPEMEIKSVVLTTLEIWLAQRNSKNSDSFTESAVPFVQRLLTENRELFETLAQR